jgi:hypothetical protein
LLGLISRANGGYGPQVMRAAEQIAEIITKSHTRELEDIVRKQIKTGKPILEQPWNKYQSISESN